LNKRTLPIDTKYYAQEFKEKLLERITSSPVIQTVSQLNFLLRKRIKKVNPLPQGERK